MSDQLTALRLFVRVAQTGSFSRAAKELKLSQPTSSRMITDLEKKLGVTLVSRSTRAISLTEAGVEYLDRVKGVLETLEEADQAVRKTGELRGTLRVASSSVFATRVVLPRLQSFLDVHPALRIELLVDDKRQNLVADGIDVAIRFGKLTDSNATARRLGSWALVAVASPKYLRAHGTPKSPNDLTTHMAVMGGPARDGKWVFRRQNREIAVKVDGPLTISASEVAMRAGLDGLGIVVASYPSLKKHLEKGELVRVLPDWEQDPIEAHAVYPSGQAKPAARAFTEFLIRELAEF